MEEDSRREGRLCDALCREQTTALETLQTGPYPTSPKIIPGYGGDCQCIKSGVHVSRPSALCRDSVPWKIDLTALTTKAYDR